MALLIAILTFLAVGTVVVMVVLLATTESRQKVILHRLEAVRKVERREGTTLGLKLLRDEMLSSVPLLHRWMAQWSWSGRVQSLLTQAGMTIRTGKFLLICGVLGMAAYAITPQRINPLQAVVRVPWLPVVAGVAAGAIPFAVAAWKRRRRMRQFEEHFPEALDLLGRAVRAGHAFTTGLEMIGKEATEPIAGEFRKTFDEQNFGIPLRDALINLAERVPLVDVRFFVTALLVQRETGGNLAEVLDGLAHVIRDRFRIQREVRIKTAQGRLTAAILIALPPVMGCLLGMINPSYMRVLFEDPRGPMVLAIAALAQLMGTALIWKIIRIEV